MVKSVMRSQVIIVIPQLQIRQTTLKNVKTLGNLSIMNRNPEDLMTLLITGAEIRQMREEITRGLEQREVKAAQKIHTSEELITSTRTKTRIMRSPIIGGKHLTLHFHGRKTKIRIIEEKTLIHLMNRDTMKESMNRSDVTRMTTLIVMIYQNLMKRSIT